MFYRCELKYTTNYVNWILIRIIKENVLAKFTQLKYEVISKDNNEKLRKIPGSLCKSQGSDEKLELINLIELNESYR